MVMELVVSDYCIRHRFTVAYSPWSKGTVESVNKHVPAARRAITTEISLGKHDWPSVLE